MSTSTATSSVAVGDRNVSESRTVAEILSRTGTVVPAASTAMGMLAAEALVPALDGRRSRLRWSADDPISSTDTVTAESVVTRVAGRTVERYVRLLDDRGTARESGTETWTFDTAIPSRPELSFCTSEWGALLAESLAEDPEFTSSLSTWDGTIGLRSGDIELHLRIYKGRIVDVTRRTPHGATFTFVAPDHAWVDLTSSEENDFMRRAIRGEFSSTGDGYEYLRLTKPLNTIIGHARALARKARS